MIFSNVFGKGKGKKGGMERNIFIIFLKEEEVGRNGNKD